MKTPKVAFVRQRYAQDGGAERFVSRALEALRSRKVSLTLVTREWRGGEGFEILTCNPFYLGRLWRDWSFARAVCRELENRSFDLVQSHERLACCDIYRAGDGVHREWLRQLARVRGPSGRLGIALNPYHLYTKWAEKCMFTSPRLKAVICNSKMVRDEIKHHFGLTDDRLHVIYSGVDTNAYHPDLRRHRAEIRQRHGMPDNATLFLFVGSGFERKGVAALLRALAALPKQACLLVVGRDKRLAKYRERAAALGLGQRVVFAGSQADVRPYYGAADALVLPTLYDPFPNVALEAMACGLAVVTSTKCGAAELIRPGENGFVVDSQDIGGLAESLRALLEPERIRNMGGVARATVEFMRLDRMSQELVNLYQGLI
jgi:UDP-glucose:(heptosyl)LPS alpha-1,3-glucosyltransferase